MLAQHALRPAALHSVVATLMMSTVDGWPLYTKPNEAVGQRECLSAYLDARTRSIVRANGNSAWLPYIGNAVKTDPRIYLSTEVKADLFRNLAKSLNSTLQLGRAWTKIKVGQ